MAKQIINIGTEELSGDGESLRSAFNKINQNFTETYDKWGAINVNGSVISTNDSSNITISQELTLESNLQMQGHIIPALNSTYDLGSPSKQWRSIYVGTETLYINNVPITVDEDGNLSVNGSIVSQTDRLINGNKSVTLGSNGILTLSNGGTIEFPDSSIQETAYRYTASATAPTLTTGAIWFNSEEGRLYINYNNTWVEASPTQIDPSALRADSTSTIELPSGLTITQLGNYIPVNGTIMMQAPNELLEIVSSGTNASTIVGWSEHPYEANGGLSLIQFNDGVSNGARIMTGSFSSQIHYWDFQPNGILTLPESGDIINSGTGLSVLSNYTSVPAHSYGANGDKEGMLAFDASYIYYCTADYVNNSTDIWKRIAYSVDTW